MRSIDVVETAPRLDGRARRRWLSDRAIRRKVRVLAFSGTRGARA